MLPSIIEINNNNISLTFINIIKNIADIVFKINNLYSESVALKIKSIVENIKNLIIIYLNNTDANKDLLLIINRFNSVYASYYKYLLSSECGLDKNSQENSDIRYLQDNSEALNENNTNSFYILENASNLRLVRENYINILRSYLKANNVDFLKLLGGESSQLIENEVFSVYYILNNEKDYNKAKLNNLPYIEYIECEKELKTNNIMKETDYLITLIVKWNPLKNKDMSNSIISTILIDNNNNIVDKSLCGNVSVKFPVDQNSEQYISYKNINDEYGVDIFDKDGPFYNDICFTFDNEGYDITLSKRKSMFPYSINCSEGCIYKGIDKDNYSTCNCDNKKTDDLEGNFAIDFIHGLTDSNIMLVTCFEKAFDKKRLLYNIGFYFLTSLTVIAIAFLIFIVCILDKKYIKKNMKEIIRMDALYYNLNIYEKYDENSVKSNKINSFSDMSSINTNLNNNKYNSNTTIRSDNNLIKGGENTSINTLQFTNSSPIKNNIPKDNKSVNNDECKKVSVLISKNSLATNITNNLNNTINKKSVIKNINEVQELEKIEEQEDIQKEKPIISNNIINDNKSLKNPTSLKLFDNYTVKNNNYKPGLKISNYDICNSIYNKPNHKYSNITIIDDTSSSFNNKPWYTSYYNNKHFVYNDYTIKDYKEMIIQIELVTDNRSFCKYFYDSLLMNHDIVSLFQKSLIRPLYIRFLELMFNISLQTVFNAIFYSDELINSKVHLSTEEVIAINNLGFISTIFSDFSKSLSSTLTSLLIILLGKIIIYVPVKYENEFNLALITQETNKIYKG